MGVRAVTDQTQEVFGGSSTWGGARTPRKAGRGARLTKIMSDRPRFHAEKNHEFIRGRSPDFQAKPFISGFRPSAFPGYTEWLLEDFYRPDYSGGTVPDLNRLPFYVLADTSDRRRNNHNIRLSCDWPLLCLLFCREEGSHLFPRRHELRIFICFQCNMCSAYFVSEPSLTVGPQPQAGSQLSDPARQEGGFSPPPNWPGPDPDRLTGQLRRATIKRLHLRAMPIF